MPPPTAPTPPESFAAPAYIDARCASTPAQHCFGFAIPDGYLLSRNHHRFLLAPATVEDTTEYVRCRPAAADTDRAIFPDDALSTLHELSQGAVRKIDKLATAALREAARRKKKLVDRDLVTRVAESLVRFD